MSDSDSATLPFGRIHDLKSAFTLRTHTYNKRIHVHFRFNRIPVHPDSRPKSALFCMHTHTTNAVHVRFGFSHISVRPDSRPKKCAFLRAHTYNGRRSCSLPIQPHSGSFGFTTARGAFPCARTHNEKQKSLPHSITAERSLGYTVHIHTESVYTRTHCVSTALFYRIVANRVFSARLSLTAVFGMGTGGPSTQIALTSLIRFGKAASTVTVEE